MANRPVPFLTTIIWRLFGQSPRIFQVYYISAAGKNFIFRWHQQCNTHDLIWQIHIGMVGMRTHRCDSLLESLALLNSTARLHHPQWGLMATWSILCAVKWYRWTNEIPCIFIVVHFYFHVNHDWKIDIEELENYCKKFLYINKYCFTREVSKIRCI